MQTSKQLRLFDFEECNDCSSPIYEGDWAYEATVMISLDDSRGTGWISCEKCFDEDYSYNEFKVGE